MFLNILGRLKIIAMLLLSRSEEELIRRIILGCENFVYKMEDKRYNRKFKSRKISQRQRVQLSVLFPSLSEPYTDKGFRSFPKVRSRLAEIENITLDKSVVCNSLKTLLNVGYLQKRTLKKHSELSSTNTQYHESDYVHALKDLVSKPIPRTIIYYRLLQSNILLRYLTILKYSELLMCKRIEVEDVIKAGKARGLINQEKYFDAFKQKYAEDKKFLQNKTNKEILFNAKRFATEEIQSMESDDPTYKTVFVVGGISYLEIEDLPFKT